jgi:biotin transport system substrate-specific component
MLAVLAYLLVGALGAPVFAGGASGIGHLAGASGGYLVGFVFGADLAGVWHRRRPSGGFGGALAMMLAAHVAILFFGWARLAMSSGGGQAYAAGVAPFMVGGLAKSAAAALVLMAWERWRMRTHAESTRG